MMKLLLLVLLVFVGCGDPADSDEPIPTLAPQFRFTLTNVSAPGSLGGANVLYAPGVFAIHDASVALYRAGQSASAGLEALAEDGMTETMLQEANETNGVVVASTFGQVETGMSYKENPISPGTSAAFRIRVEPGQRLSLATMFIQSNDIFLGTPEGGIALFDGDTPREGDITADLVYWDAGTEVNEEPGAGPNQPPRQGTPNTGETEGGTVTQLDAEADNAGFSYPPVAATVTLVVVVGE
jgi:hypothetical protein